MSSGKVTIQLSITVNKCHLEDEELRANALEKRISQATRMGGEGLAKMLWAMGEWEDLQVTKVTKSILTEVDLT